MCKVGEVGAGSRMRISRGGEDVPAEVTEEVKLLVVEVLLLVVVVVHSGTAHNRRLGGGKQEC